MSGQIDESATFAIVGDHVVGEVFDGEAIIIDTITGAYYSLPEGAAQVWSVLTSGATTFSQVANDTSPDIAGAVLSELVEAGLLITSATMPTRADNSPRYLSKYSDMEELLMLDPIHDVSPAGWPAEMPDSN